MELGFENFTVYLGLVKLREDRLPDNKKERLEIKLNSLGFELISDKKSKLIEAIKTIVITKIHHGELADQNLTWSGMISEELNYEYKYISRLFSSMSGISIEQYIILQKIEKVKELIVYNQLTLSEIAFKLGYSSVAHLSYQFKKVTGMTPSDFKLLGSQNRKSLQEV